MLSALNAQPDAPDPGLAPPGQPRVSAASRRRSAPRTRRTPILLAVAAVVTAVGATTAAPAIAAPRAVPGQVRADNAGGQLSVGMMPAGSPDAVHRGARVRTGRSAAGPVNTQYGPDLASYQHPNGQPV
ncbi:MAG TPA: hypothetical protein VGN54_09520, partial [Mycobacteriales bacterium]|nr:hypothetical protein [Mycobacteriales bacterium]